MERDFLRVTEDKTINQIKSERFMADFRDNNHKGKQLFWVHDVYGAILLSNLV